MGIPPLPIPLAGFAMDTSVPSTYRSPYTGSTSKPTAHILTCQNCGAPLEPEPGASQVRCGYCQVVSVVERGKAKVRAKSGVNIPDDLARLSNEINRLHKLTLSLIPISWDDPETY